MEPLFNQLMNILDLTTTYLCNQQCPLSEVGGGGGGGCAKPFSCQTKLS